jgi:TonB family protein
MWLGTVAGILMGVAVWGQTQAGGNYHGAGVARASDVAYPINTGTTGIVTLDVSVDATGVVQKVDVVRDVPPLTSAAASAVKNWKFSPATLGGQPVAGIARVTVVFNPYNPGGVGLPGEPLKKGAESGAVSSGDFQPAQVKTANYAAYPASTVTWGAVVLELLVGTDGKVSGVRVVKSLGMLNAAATRAVKGWEFAAASYKGKAVASRLAVAFVFAAPQAGAP